jgi:hypothetical protein
MRSGTTQKGDPAMSLTLQELYDKAGKRSMVYLVPGENIAFIADYSAHTKHVYLKEENGLFSEIDLNLKEMALKMSEGLDKVEFIKDVLKTMPIEQLIEVSELLSKPETTVKSKPGCFNLIVSNGEKRSRIVLR